MATKKVGAYVKEARASAKLTQEKLGQATGIPAGDIGKCERGEIDLTGPAEEDCRCMRRYAEFAGERAEEPVRFRCKESRCRKEGRNCEEDGGCEDIHRKKDRGCKEDNRGQDGSS